MILATLSSSSGLPLLSRCPFFSQHSDPRSTCSASALLRGAVRLTRSGMAQSHSDAASETVRSPWHLVTPDGDAISRGPTRHGLSASRLCSHHLLPHGRRGTLGARRTSTRGLPLHCRPDRWPLPFPHPAHPFLCPLPATTRGHRAPRTRRLDHSRQLFAPCDRRSQFRLSAGVPRPSLFLGHAVALGHVVGTAPVPARGGLFSTTTD